MTEETEVPWLPEEWHPTNSGNFIQRKLNLPEEYSPHNKLHPKEILPAGNFIHKNIRHRMPLPQENFACMKLRPQNIRPQEPCDVPFDQNLMSRPHEFPPSDCNSSARMFSGFPYKTCVSLLYLRKPLLGKSYKPFSAQEKFAKSFLLVHTRRKL
ncbi:hypothetical protein BaRGS_00004804 [Batillaria attramentaria]|uniref:Uncharacterized protein n=1 Tax=Batillaria attramentaria TaxID=370345 RepID=A0ABD0LYL0_9CAEN